MDKLETKGIFKGRKGAQRLYIILTLAFPTVHFIVFWLWVNIDSLLLPFQNNIGEFIGVTNFRWVFDTFLGANKNLDMLEATKNTLIFFFWNLLVEMPIAVVLAYVFFKKIPGSKFFTIVLYLPSIISATVMTTVFKNFLSNDGPFAIIWVNMGKEWVYPITNEATSIPSMLAYNLWNGYGLNIILFCSAMRRIPREIFESAAMDGITMGKELTSIIIPLIWPTLSTMLILAFIGIFGADGPILLFTNGEYGTMTIGFAMYQQYKVFNQVARAAAIGFVYTMVGLPLVFFCRWLTGKLGGEYEY
jgi:ABC-type sugar transport system permease subunit